MLKRFSKALSSRVVTTVSDVPEETEAETLTLSPVLESAPNYQENMEEHPLLMEHILDKIFYYLAPTDEKWHLEKATYLKNVQNFRLVCKLWRDRATLALGNLRPGFSISFLSGCSPFSKKLRMKRFLSTMKSSRSIPFKRYCFSLNVFYTGKQNQNMLEEFLETCGPTAVELKFKIPDNFKIRLPSYIPHFNLGQLKILECQSRLGSTLSDDVYHFLILLLTGAQNLETFSFLRSHETSEKMVEMFRKIPKSVKKLCVKSLLLWTDQHFLALAHAKLQLEECRLSGAEMFCRSSAHCIFFEGQSPTLKTLELKSNASLLIFLSFPKLEELLHLSVQLRKDEVVIGPFSLPDIFPKLVTLEVESFQCKDAYMELLSSWKGAPSLETLKLSSSVPQTEFIWRAGHIFPNIRKFIVAQSDTLQQTLSEVFTHLTNIEELQITLDYKDYSATSGDSLLSGISTVDCIKIFEDCDFTKVDREITEQQPSILNLTKLKKLVMRGGYPKRVVISDISVHFLFLEMSTLGELRIPYLKVSEEKFIRLQNQLKVLKVENLVMTDIESAYFDDDCYPNELKLSMCNVPARPLTYCSVYSPKQRQRHNIPTISML